MPLFLSPLNICFPPPGRFEVLSPIASFLFAFFSSASSDDAAPLFFQMAIFFLPFSSFRLLLLSLRFSLTPFRCLMPPPRHRRHSSPFSSLISPPVRSSRLIYASCFHFRCRFRGFGLPPFARRDISPITLCRCAAARPRQRADTRRVLFCCFRHCRCRHCRAITPAILLMPNFAAPMPPPF